MNLYSVPYLSGKKSIISGYGLLILGIAGLLTAVGNCLTGLDLQQCYVDITSAYEPLLAAFMGLGVIGISHKQVKSEATMKEIKKETVEIGKTADKIEVTTESTEKTRVT